jgi:predicted Fe-Mo cluster-binding NifX family protein
MKIALPVAGGSLSMHFGHTEGFALVDVDREGRNVIRVEIAPAPPHEPGVLPRWLAERGVDLVIAGGMGRRAQDLFAQSGIEVIVGAPAGDPEELVRAYLADGLVAGPNVCDH